jgi:putative DNA primase/helicase
MTSNISPAAIFRTIEAAHPTLLIDEADTFLHGNEEMRGILNSGHDRAGAYVIRTVGEDHQPAKFSTWCPMAVAKIGKLPDTLADRAIPINLKRKAPGEKVERLRLDRIGFWDEARMAARWAQNNEANLQNADPDVPDALNDRAQDNWRPLIAIAEAAGGDWADKARMAALKLSGEQQGDDEVKTQLLADLRQLFKDRGADKLSSQDICVALAEMEDRPWPEWRHGKAITPAQLGRLLKPFGIAPATIRLDLKTAKGYKRESFKDAFDRYLPPQSVTPSQATEFKGFGPKPKRHTDADVTFPNSPKPTISKGCDGVTDRNGEPGGERHFVACEHAPEGTDGMDGKAALCVQCGRQVAPSDEPIPVAEGGWLHLDCYDAFFGFERGA